MGVSIRRRNAQSPRRNYDSFWMSEWLGLHCTHYGGRDERITEGLEAAGTRSN